MQNRPQAEDGGRHSHLHGIAIGPTGELFEERFGRETWQAPTLRELADRVEHQFGQLPALSEIHALGFARDEPLAPCDIYLVCDLLGLPATDFGRDI